MRTSIHSLLITVAAFSLACAATRAGIVIWEAPHNITVPGVSDVSLDGTLVGAYNLSGIGALAASPVINGVQFSWFLIPFNRPSASMGNFTLAGVGGNLIAGSDVAFTPPFTDLSFGYYQMLETYGTGILVPMRLTMNGLTPGNQYEFQWWDNYSTNPGSGQGIVTATAGNSITLNGNPSGIDGGLGQFGIGRFVADATGSQAITFSSPPVGGAGALVNGFQLRNTTPVPEPSTALFGLVLCAAPALRRQR